MCMWFGFQMTSLRPMVSTIDKAARVASRHGKASWAPSAPIGKVGAGVDVDEVLLAIVDE